MKIINKTYRFRLFPTKEQEEYLSKVFGCVRFIYNKMLYDKIEHYKQTGEMLKNTPAQYKKEFPFLKEVDSLALANAQINLEKAYKNFFRDKKIGFPKFKKKKGNQSYTTNNQNGTVEIINRYLKIPKLKTMIKVKQHRLFEGKIKSVTISKTPTGKYYASIFTEQIIDELPKTGKQVGIDLGLKDFVITSDNKKFKNNRYIEKYAKQLKKAQRHLSRKQKGSNGFEKQKLKVAKIHEKIANCRLDTLHKVSRKLVNEFDVIVCEDLNVKDMIKNRKLSKHIADASWGKFVTFLQYKCDWYGKTLVKVNRFYPSSKTCSECGWINQELKLSDREWTCKSCGVVHDRDVNANKNILKEGLKIISVGTTDYTDGDLNDASLQKHKSVKSET